MTGKTAVESWRQMYHELKEASESKDAAYEKVITELREELFNRTADLETVQFHLASSEEYINACAGAPDRIWEKFRSIKARLDAKTKEFIRMENAWRGELDKVYAGQKPTGSPTLFSSLNGKLKAAQAQLDAVRPYLHHSLPNNHCDYMKHSDNKCTCGLDDLLKALEKDK